VTLPPKCSGKMCEGAFAERYSTVDGQRGQKYMCASVEPVAIVGMGMTYDMYFIISSRHENLLTAPLLSL